MPRIYVIPREGTLVPDPVLRDHLPPEGRWVDSSEHWTRVIERDRDASESEAPEVEAPPAAPPAEPSAEPAPEAVFTPPTPDEEHAE